MNIEKEDILMEFQDNLFYNISLCRVNNKPRKVLLAIKDMELFKYYLAKNSGDAPPIPDEVEVIADAVFKHIGALEYVTLPQSLVCIGESAFKRSGLVYADFSKCKNLITIEDSAFYGTSLKEIDLSACENLVFLGEFSFGINSCEHVKLPKERYKFIKLKGAFSKNVGGNTSLRFNPENNEDEQLSLF